MKQRKNRLSQVRIIALGFFLIILSGAFLLMLPISSRSGEVTSLMDALFTSVSATCVTGLIVVDTFTHWSVFGQLVILSMIQIGGLGFITIAVFFSMLLHRKIGLKQRGLVQESINSLHIGGMVRLTKKIILGTFLVEGIGAVLLAIRFSSYMGFWESIYNGVFHSISAFCNAGFDLMGRYEKFSSFTMFYDDWLINLVIMALIIIGGIGFLVWDDVTKHKWHMKRYLLHTKIVLCSTLILIVGGAVLFYFLERDGVLEGMSVKGQILSSFFSSVTCRTAGFNTVDLAAIKESSKLLHVILMFIGGSPGSTAGGVKTTTFVVMLLYLRSLVKRTYGCNVFGRRLEEIALKRSCSVFTLNLMLAISVTMFICIFQPFLLSDALFEAFSAIGTVGMSTGITRDLSAFSQVALMFLMYFGRIGSLSFALSLWDKKKMPHVRQPEERIIVG